MRPVTKAFLLLGLLATSAYGELRFALAGPDWGLEFRHHHCGSGQFYMVETMGSGVVIFDYDGDGDADVFFVDSGKLPGCRDAAPRSRLFRNDGGRRFADVTGAAGIEVDAYGMGATAGDVDGDGDLDLYVTAFGPNQLFANNGDGTFTDVTETAGVGDPLWSASAAFADPDGDGDLDLYVTNYVDFDFDNNPICGIQARGIRSYCHPDVYDGLPDRYYENRGGGTFRDATEESGLGGARGNGLGVVWSDLNGDGRTDLYVANDMTFNYHFENQGTAKFEDAALFMGTAVSLRGNPEAGMGVEARDLGGDGIPEIFVTHLDKETNAYYVSQGQSFADRRFESGLAAPSMFKVGFGTAFADFDSDGDLDLVVANGHIIHNVEEFGTGTTYRQANQLFENTGGSFREVTPAGLSEVRASRGLAVGDLDGDGDLDVVISNSNDQAEVYRNDSPATGRWLRFDLDVAAGNRHGIGARVELRTAAGPQVREIRTASSYLSQNERTLHFGVLEEGGVELLVRLADRPALRLRNLAANRRWTARWTAANKG